MQSARLCAILYEPQSELHQTHVKESHARSYFDIFLVRTTQHRRGLVPAFASRAEQSRAEVIQPSSLFARRTVKPTNRSTTSMVARNNKGILCSKKKHVSPHFLCMPGKWEKKVFQFRNMSLTLLSNEAILYIENARARHSSLRGSSNAVPACSSRARNTQFKDKPDMIEANTTYLWQTPYSVDAKSFCASAPASLSRTQSGFSFNHRCADRGISVPVSAFFVPGKHRSAVRFSTN